MCEQSTVHKIIIVKAFPTFIIDCGQWCVPFIPVSKHKLCTRCGLPWKAPNDIVVTGTLSVIIVLSELTVTPVTTAFILKHDFIQMC